MPDGKFAFYEHHNWRHQQAFALGVAEARAELIEAGKDRARGLLNDLADAFDEIEREAPGSMRVARLHLVDMRAEVEGTTP